MSKTTFKSTSSRVLRFLLLLLGIVVGMGGLMFLHIVLITDCEGDLNAHIAPDGKTPACEAELVSGMNQILKRNNLEEEATKGHASKIFHTGTVNFYTSWAGTQVSIALGLVVEDDSCFLRFYKRQSNEPGRSVTTLGNFGSVKLKLCRCIED